MTERIERTHTIDIDLPADDAFPLFSPRGEEAWASGWKPEYVHPANGETLEGMVFRTGEGVETTLWSCIAFDEVSHRVKYVRVTPASRFATVEVVCSAVGPSRTQVHVTYVITALTPHGCKYLAGLRELEFRSMIEGWRQAIGDMLARSAA
jgi:hypothetical protein